MAYAKILKANPFHDKAGKFTSKDKDSDGSPSLPVGKSGLLAKYSGKQVRDHFLKKLSEALVATNISSPQHQQKLRIGGETVNQQGLTLLGGTKLLMNTKSYLQKYGFSKNKEVGAKTSYLDKHGNTISVFKSGATVQVYFGG